GLAGILKFSNVAAGEALCEGLQQFAGSLAGISRLTAQKPVEQFQHEKQPSEQKDRSNWLFILAIVLFVLLPAYVAFQYATKAGDSLSAHPFLASAENSFMAVNLVNRPASSSSSPTQPIVASFAPSVTPSPYYPRQRAPLYSSIASYSPRAI